ncbi:hypothetical protein CVT25_006135 [Psilocybe cyanescens]|uniref:Arginyl-tRNA synthetase catalytic core domain-containing protein n=1 Tax=Psilocybe cyanescens TaxID=93625 RepID=A0A409WZ45_PSICY|nr:hypothetical protein CVT25_006135 [Psilocybe cyanescens]
MTFHVTRTMCVELDTLGRHTGARLAKNNASKTRDLSAALLHFRRFHLRTTTSSPTYNRLTKLLLHTKTIVQKLSNALSLMLEQGFAGVDYGRRGRASLLRSLGSEFPGSSRRQQPKVIENFQPEDWVESVVLNKSFLHFSINTRNKICQVLTQIDALTRNAPCGQPEYGTNDSSKGKVTIEYSPPNIAQSFYVWHVWSTTIRTFLANLYKACRWGHLDELSRRLGYTAPLRHLRRHQQRRASDPTVKASVAQLLKRMEDTDEDALHNCLLTTRPAPRAVLQSTRAHGLPSCTSTMGYLHTCDIAFLLDTYPDVVEIAMKTQERSGVVTFAFQLSNASDVIIVKGEEEEDEKRRGRRCICMVCAGGVGGCNEAVEFEAVGKDVNRLTGRHRREDFRPLLHSQYGSTQVHAGFILFPLRVLARNLVFAFSPYQHPSSHSLGPPTLSTGRMWRTLRLK